MSTRAKRRQQKRDRTAIAAAAKRPEVVIAGGELAWRPIEANEDGEENRLPRFDMVAYTGGKLSVAAYWHPVVLELSGIKAAGDQVPIDKDHDPGQVVGHSEEVSVQAGKLRVSGVVSGTGPRSTRSRRQRQERFSLASQRIRGARQGAAVCSLGFDRARQRPHFQRTTFSHPQLALARCHCHLNGRRS